MIKLLVDLYRVVIVIILVLAGIVAIPIMGAGGLGIFAAVGFMFAVILFVGISATLLSINDHLSAMRLEVTDKTPVPHDTLLSPVEQRRRNTALAVIGGVALLIFALAALFGTEPKPQGDRALSSSGALFLPENEPLVEASDRNMQRDPMCDPELARRMGSRC